MTDYGARRVFMPISIPDSHDVDTASYVNYRQVSLLYESAHAADVACRKLKLGPRLQLSWWRD